MQKKHHQKTATPAKASPAYEIPEYLLKEENRSIPVDGDRIRQFKDLHKGQRCFIVGNGPSLNQTDLSKLKDEITFGVNGIFLLSEETGFVPTYYAVCDSFVIEENADQINSLSVQHKFFPSQFRKFIDPKKRENVSFFMLNRGYNEVTSPNHAIPRFSADCSERIYDGQTVTYVNLQLAYYMGFSEVYLIGVDFSYVIPESAIVDGCNITSTEDDPNHFHKDYFGKGRSWHDPVLHRVVRNYQFADLVFKWDGRQVFNATKGGKLEAFERVDYDTLFAPSSGRGRNITTEYDTWQESITLTMDGLLIGTGWHPVEHMDDRYFRWLGPENQGTINILPYRDRENRLNITFCECIGDDVFKGLVLEVDGLPVTVIANDCVGAGGGSKEGQYSITATLPKDVAKVFGEPTVLTLRVPRSAQEKDLNPGSKENRRISIALQSVTVSPMIAATQMLAAAPIVQGNGEPDLRTANRLFREGEYAAAMKIYSQLFELRPMRIYEDNALLCARKMGLKNVATVQDLRQRGLVS